MQWSGNADVQMETMTTVLSFGMPLPLSAWLCNPENVLLILVLEEHTT